MATAHILAVGKLVDGTFAWQIAMPPLPDEAPQDDELQRMIDEGEMTADYEDWILDVEWLRLGC